MLHELTENQKDFLFERSSSLILCKNCEPFLDQIVMCDKRRILYDNWWWPAQWLDLAETSEHFPKAKLAPKKGHGHCLVVCCCPDLLQLSEYQENHHIWEVCSAHLWDALKPTMPAAGVGQQNGLSSSPWHCWLHVSQPAP